MDPDPGLPPADGAPLLGGVGGPTSPGLGEAEEGVTMDGAGVIVVCMESTNVSDPGSYGPIEPIFTWRK